MGSGLGNSMGLGHGNAAARRPAARPSAGLRARGEKRKAGFSRNLHGIKNGTKDSRAFDGSVETPKALGSAGFPWRANACAPNGPLGPRTNPPLGVPTVRPAADRTRGPRTTHGRIPSKQIQIKPSKKAWISLVLFVRIGTFQWVTSEKIKKSTRVSSCVQNVSKRASPTLFSSRAAWRRQFDPASRNYGSPYF